MNLICQKNKVSFFEDLNIADISYYYSRLRLDKTYHPYELFYWDKGHCYREYIIDNELTRENIMYIHFQRRKLKNFIDRPNLVNSFMIKEDGFYENDTEVIDMNYISNYCTFGDYKFEQREKRQYIINKIKNVIKKTRKEKYIWVKQQIALKEYNKN